jgi:hypothetical protein
MKSTRSQLVSPLGRLGMSTHSRKIINNNGPVQNPDSTETRADHHRSARTSWHRRIAGPHSAVGSGAIAWIVLAAMFRGPGAAEHTRVG